MSGDITFKVGDCLDVFGAEPDASVDAFVSDWPAGVAFMGRAWDKDRGGRAAWIAHWTARAEMMRRKSKAGAFSLTWALPRTSHWTATALEDAGWVVQDIITHVFGQGWPKGRSALKPASEHWILARNGSGGALQIDAARVARGAGDWPDEGRTGGHSAQPDALKISGAPPGDGIRCPPGGSWPPNFALSHCPDCEERGARMVRGSAPASGPTLTGPSGSSARSKFNGVDSTPSYGTDGLESVPAFDCLAACDCGLSRLAASGGEAPRCACGGAMWWACPVAEMDRQSGQGTSNAREPTGRDDRGVPGFVARRLDNMGRGHVDSGGASRFFPRFSYNAKAPGGERQAGCDDLYWRADKRSPFGFAQVTREEWETLDGDCNAYGEESATGSAARGRDPRSVGGQRARGNVHPTVKGLDLMRRWVALVTPPGGRVGDITAGSGGTGIATHLLNAALPIGGAPMSFLGCDICPEAVEIAEARLRWWRSVRHDVKPVKRQAEPVEKPAQATLFPSTVLSQVEMFARVPA